MMANYSDTGEKPLIILTFQGNRRVKCFTVKAGESDIYSVDIQLTKTSQRISMPNYKNISEDTLGSVPASCYAIGLNISVNVSNNIVLDIDE